MSIAVKCGSCGRDYTVKDDAAGKKFKCKDCGDVVEVPAGMAAEEVDEFAGLEGDLEAGDVARGALPPVTGVRRRGTSRGNGSRSNALAKVNGPGSSLMIVAGISIGFRVLMLGLSAIGIAMIPQMQPGAAANGAAIGQVVGGIVGNLVALLFNVATFTGAMKMRGLESRSQSWAAAIIAVIPICSPCCVLGIPFGIWALVVLNDNEVRDAFAS